MTTQLLPERGDLTSPEDLERAYMHPRATHLRVNFVASLDGAVEIDGRSGPLGGPVDRSAFMAMRGLADVVMVGAGTARAEDYGPVRLGDDVQRRRVERCQTERPPLAVVTARGDLSPDARLFGPGSDVIILTSSRVVAERPELGRVAEVIGCGDVHLDLTVAVTELRRRGLGRILCEGGAELMRSLMLVDLVDELCLTLAPVLAGSQHRNLSGHGPLPRMERFRLASLIEGDGQLLTRYERLPPL